MTDSTGMTVALIAIALFYVLVLVLAGILYFFPTVVAFRRGHDRRWLILLANAVAGATVVGWIGCLVWALQLIGDRGVRVDNYVTNLPPQLARAKPAPSGFEQASDELLRLNRLHKEGALGDQEYQTLRSLLLEALKR